MTDMAQYIVRNIEAREHFLSDVREIVVAVYAKAQDLAPAIGQISVAEALEMLRREADGYFNAAEVRRVQSTDSTNGCEW